MELINGNGLVLIGPGSEWFWGAVSGVVLAVTFLAIYRQLRLQRGQAAIEQLDRFEQEYGSERLLRCRLAFYTAEVEGMAPEDLPQDVGSVWMNYWERVASLARHGYIDLDLLWEGGSGFQAHRDWLRMEPSIRRSRADTGNPEIGAAFEWLSKVMEARASKSGVRLPTRAETVRDLPLAIASLEAMIRLEADLRSGAGTAGPRSGPRRARAAGH